MSAGTSLRGGDAVEARLLRPDGRVALVPFLMAGFPQRAGFQELLLRVAAVADLVEIGLPFRDPVADGPVLQRAGRAALAGGATLDWLLAAVAEVRGELRAPVGLMSYANPLLAGGFGRTAERLAAAGFDALILPDVPLDEAEAFGTVAGRAGLALVQLVTPLSPPARRRAAAERTRGFLYAVTRTGVTGGGTEVARVREHLVGLRALGPRPVCAGFGLESATDLAALSGAVDGAIVGSALARALERGADPVAFLSALTAGGRP